MIVVSGPVNLLRVLRERLSQKSQLRLGLFTGSAPRLVGMAPDAIPEAARTKQAERRDRVRRIRRRTIGGSLATFAAVWVAIFFQLVTGHDPVLSTDSKAQPAAAVSTSTATSPSYSDSPTETESPTETDAPTQTLNPTTTRQS